MSDTRRLDEPLTEAQLKHIVQWYEGEVEVPQHAATQDCHVVRALRELTRLKQLVRKGRAVVDDFMPNIGKCALQDYARLNEFMVESAQYIDRTNHDKKKGIQIVLCVRDGVISLVEGESALMVMEWYRCNGPAAYERVQYRELPVRYPGQLLAAEIWYACKIQRPFITRSKVVT